MTQLLRIDSSARYEGSHSRQLGDYFQEKWLSLDANRSVVTRDLTTAPIEQISQDTIEGFYTPKEQMSEKLKRATSLSDQLIREVHTSNVLLITVPMYNFSVPSALKAWIDQIVRMGETFSYEQGEFKGLINKPEAYVICSYGAAGYLNGGNFASANFLAPYLEFVLTFLGISSVKFVNIESTTGDESIVNNATKQAKSDIDKLLSVSA
ncbi:FMN-dependent NADH-azoreductase [Marinomonas epiphytica]